jgi:hypothetical protein
MKILIANVCLGGRTGSEVHTKDLALTLQRRGHQCAIFVRVLKEDLDVASLRVAGVIVTDNLRKLNWVPDVIHGHHLLQTVQACLAFPQTPAIQVCHDATNRRDRAGSSPCIQKWAAVDAFCQERYIRETGLKPEDIPIIFNAVDLDLFSERNQPPPSHPRNAALFFSSRDTPQITQTISAVCSRLGIRLDIIGPGTSGFVNDPEKVLSQYDLVFGKARCAIEAMASGAHVILCSPRGVGPQITPENFDQLRQRNFGQSLLSLPLNEVELDRRIKELDSTNTEILTKLIRSQNNTIALAILVEKIHQNLIKMNTNRHRLALWQYYFWVRFKMDRYFKAKAVPQS